MFDVVRFRSNSLASVVFIRSSLFGQVNNPRFIGLQWIVFRDSFKTACNGALCLYWLCLEEEESFNGIN